MQIQDSHSQCQIGHSPVFSYTIKYFDNGTNIRCGSDTITASSCTDQICNSVYDLGALCSKSTHVTVIVLGIDVQGNEQESEPFLVILRKPNFNFEVMLP